VIGLAICACLAALALRSAHGRMLRPGVAIAEASRAMNDDRARAYVARLAHALGRCQRGELEAKLAMPSGAVFTVPPTGLYLTALACLQAAEPDRYSVPRVPVELATWIRAGHELNSFQARYLDFPTPAGGPLFQRVACVLRSCSEAEEAGLVPRGECLTTEDVIAAGLCTPRPGAADGVLARFFEGRLKPHNIIKGK
jgi:hypothetical protein